MGIDSKTINKWNFTREELHEFHQLLIPASEAEFFGDEARKYLKVLEANTRLPRVWEDGLKVVGNFELLEERQWLVLMIEKYFSAAFANMPKCVWEPNEKGIWAQQDAMEVRKERPPIKNLEGVLVALYKRTKMIVVPVTVKDCEGLELWSLKQKKVNVHWLCAWLRINSGSDKG
ncbi:hypothetical protein C1645_837348 [Glomus cerebriforme]|uniref:Uncharacterized protein n=1 Tax=Glomus cerebriforme TaxID=658196 RepID=A0A397SFL1_9GLOM|nr:hypothetical protein C1645_837348 [Glomus cerebriforme]